VRELVGILASMDWACVGFCQMTTHVHLLVHVHDDSLPVGMRDLNREYSCAFNLRHGRRGTFLRSRFGSRRIDTGSDLLGVYAYVVLNPVAGLLCMRPEEWRWSSYRTTVGVVDDFPFVQADAAIAEAGGSPEGLRRAVESIARARPERTRPEPGSGRVF
jgi:REP-associated tyrosine transposase